jgi:hypothetical protein
VAANAADPGGSDGAEDTPREIAQQPKLGEQTAVEAAVSASKRRSVLKGVKRRGLRFPGVDDVELKALTALPDVISSPGVS